MQSPWRLATAVGLLVFTVYVSTGSGRIVSPDGRVQWRTTRALATFRGVSIQPIEETFGTKTGRNGREYSQYGIGVPLVALPFDWIGMVLERVLPTSANVMFHFNGEQWPADIGPDTPEDTPNQLPYWLLLTFRERFGASYTNCGVNALIALFVFLLARRAFTSDKAGLGAALLYALCTINWAHTKDLYSEPLAALGWLAAFYWADFSRQQRCLRCAAAAGLAFGVALLARYDSILALPGIVLCAFYPEGEPRRLALRRAGAFAGPIVVTVGFVLLFNLYRFGSLITTGYDDAAIAGQNLAPRFALRYLPYGLYGFLFSTGKSIFFYSPILLAAVLVWYRFWRQALPLACGALTSTLIFFVTMSAYEQWPGGWCWGPRHVFQITPLIALALGWYWSDEAGAWTRLRAYALTILGTLSALIQIAGLAVGFMESHLWLKRTLKEYADFMLLYYVNYSLPVVHADMLYWGTRYLDIAALRWLLLSDDPRRFLMLIPFLGVIVCSWWVARLVRGAAQP